VHEHARLVAPDDGQLVQQVFALEGDGEDAACVPDSFGAAPHQEGRGGSSGQESERSEMSGMKEMIERVSGRIER